MKIGYPCMNRSLECTSASTFRLKSFSESRLIETVARNLECLDRILRFNIAHGLLFFRITSDLVPFASHPVMTLDWRDRFRGEFSRIGSFIRGRGIRISMHPDQFTLINSPDEGIFDRSARELLYHAEVLDLLELERSAKIQIHAGGVYGDKQESMRRFVRRFAMLDRAVRDRLVIENDDRYYTVGDCLRLHGETGIPVLLDSLHHHVNSSVGPLRDIMPRTAATWAEHDGIPMADYSSQSPGERPGKHAESIDIDDFTAFVEETRPFDLDIMLEIKDKERSALRALAAVSGDPRLSPAESL